MRMLLLLLFLTQIVTANTEKVIFLAPGITTIPERPPPQQHLCIQHTLSPESPQLHTDLPVAFPKAELPRGTESWYLLSRLTPGQRYEARVCWVATQPTEFWLQTFTLHDIITSNERLYSSGDSSPQADFVCPSGWPISSAKALEEPVLFLRVQAAADFYSLNETLMSNPPPVGVDIILDPYIFNVLPKSLLPTGLYILIITVLSWYLSSTVSSWLHGITQVQSEEKKAT